MNDRWIYVVQDTWDGGAIFYEAEADVETYKPKSGQAMSQYHVERICKVRGRIVKHSWLPTKQVGGGRWVDEQKRMVKGD